MSIVQARQIEPELIRGASVLERGRECIRAVTAGEQNRFTRAFDALQKLALSIPTPIAIVGGLGAIRYGYPAITEDIDVVIARDRLDDVLRIAPQFGFRLQWRSKSGWHTLAFEDVEINIVPEGGRARDAAPTAIPGPQALGVTTGLGYAGLPGWVELKLSSGRTKDRTHVVEVLKQSSDAQIAEIQAHIAQVDSGYLQLLSRLIADAQDEKQQEADRGKHRE